MDRIIHVGRTKEVRMTATQEEVEKLKDKLVLKRGVPVRLAEEKINERKLSVQKRSQESGKRSKPDSV